MSCCYGDEGSKISQFNSPHPVASLPDIKLLLDYPAGGIVVLEALLIAPPYYPHSVDLRLGMKVISQYKKQISCIFISTQKVTSESRTPGYPGNL
mgnify:CR=1 FL=1